MADSKHTPGPWLAAAAYSSVVGIPIVGPNGERIANASMPGLPADYDDVKQIHLTNARLIAAAPDLLETLKEMVNAPSQSPYGDTPIHKGRLERARAVIANATGGTNG